MQGIEKPYSLISAELKERAIKDDLTGLYNHQGMMDLLKYEHEQAKQEKTSLGILMIDLDDFKHINDNYGHLYGDCVLRAFGQLLMGNIRKDDFACRFGGDEFVILLRNTDSKELSCIKQRIMDDVDKWISKDEKLQGLGVSIGTSLFTPGQSFGINNLLKEADQDMYCVKQEKKMANISKNKQI